MINEGLKTEFRIPYTRPNYKEVLTYTADIGNYLYKDCFGNVIPSKVSKVKPYGSNADSLKINNVEYFIGEGEYEINAFKYKKESYLPLLLSGICKTFGANKDYITVKLGLGLPLNQHEQGEKELISMLEDTEHYVVYNGKPMVVAITTVEVYPEGVSGYQSVLYKYENRVGNRDVVVVDIGGGTTDICLISDFSAVKLTSVPFGTIHIYSAIKKALEVKYVDVKITLEKVRHYILNGFWYEGEEQDISFAIAEANYVFEKILNELRLNYPITTEITFIMGGGSEILGDSFEDYISDLVVVEDLFANANGYRDFLEDNE